MGTERFLTVSFAGFSAFLSDRGFQVKPSIKSDFVRIARYDLRFPVFLRIESCVTHDVAVSYLERCHLTRDIYQEWLASHPEFILHRLPV